jgi:glycosyltransferase involved in cell wall biosynthesis
MNDRPENTPAISVIIPTHNRARSLGHVLEKLSAQTPDIPAFEVIVVNDGSTDDTEAFLTGRDWAMDLRVLSQEQSGVAVARNAGARAARAPFLVFIDDDVAPAPGFLAAHLAAHTATPDCVSLGRLAPSDDPSANPPGWWRWLEWQFEKQYAEIERGERELHGISLYSGNFSVPTALFWQVGGFDETARYCEDAELGLRLEQAGATFRFSSGAIGHHSGYRSFESWRNAGYHGGYWDSEQMLKMRRVYSLGDLVRDFQHRHKLMRGLAQAVLGRPRLFGLTIGALRGVAMTTGALRLRKAERYAYGAIYDLTYWHGLCDGLGGFSLLPRYIRNPSTLEAAA